MEARHDATFKILSGGGVLLLSISARAQIAPDPTGTGPYTTTSAEYRMPAVVDPDVIADRATEVWARVYMPDPLLQGTIPFFVFLHGNHSTCGRCLTGTMVTAISPIGWPPGATLSSPSTSTAASTPPAVSWATPASTSPAARWCSSTSSSSAAGTGASTRLPHLRRHLRDRPCRRSDLTDVER